MTPGFTAPALVGSDSIGSVSYSYAASATATAAVGSSHSITPSSAVFTSGTASNYNITYTAGTLTIAGGASQSITFNPAATATYGDPAITLSGTATSGLPLSFTLVSGPATLSGNTLTITGAGTIVIKASQAGNSNYAAATDVTANIVVGKAALTITALAKSKTYGASDPVFTYTTTGLVSSDTMTGSLARTVGEAVGSYPINQGTVTVSAPGNYNISYTGANLTIGTASQAIAFTPQTTATYGDAPITLTATGGGSGNPVAFSVTSGPATLTGNVLTITGAGTIVVKATQAGNSNYTAASDVTANIVVAKAALTISAAAKSKTYGTSDPALTYTTTGLVSPDTMTGSLARTAGEAVGSYPITQGTVTVSVPGNYNISYTGTNLTIGKTTPTITWSTPADISYGTALSGTQLNATSSGVLGTFVYTPPTGTVLSAGSAQQLSVTFSPSDSISYNTPAATTTTINVSTKALTITANNISRAYGTANPTAPGFTAPALVGSDSIGSVSYSYAASATATAAVGSSHAITPSAAQFTSGSAGNYNITYTPGTLTVAGTASQNITFSPPATTIYGAAAITLTASATSTLPVTFTLVSGPATLTANTLTITGVGTIVIRATQGGDSNYAAASNVQKAITVEAKALSVTANNASRVFGAGNPATPGFTTLGLAGSDSIGSVSYTYAATATAAAAVGSSHAITPSNAVFSSGLASNYNIAYAAGTLTIAGGASQSITFNPQTTATYGDPAITLSATSTSGLPVNFTLVSGPATLSGSALTITGAGTITVRATQEGDSTYAAASDVQKTITVANASYTVTGSTSGNGSIQCVTPVTSGNTTTCTLTPDTGYKISVASGCGSGSLSGTTYTTGVITDSCSVSITFAAQKAGDCDANGTVTIAEVQSAINMFLGLKTVDVCVDLDNSSSVSIAEVQKVINSFLGL